MAMTLNWQLGVGGLAAYLLGAVPNGYLVGRARGVDIRTLGSGNIGATNVFRCIGKRWGIFTFALDALKGFVPAFVFPRLLVAAGVLPGNERVGAALLFMILAIAGHNWPVYLGFKGGKGVATSAGALAGVAPGAVGVGLAAFALLFAASRYVSAASIGAALAVGAGGWWLYHPEWARPAVLSVLALLVVLRHRGNIARLLAGTEHRISFRRKERT